MSSITKPATYYTHVRDEIVPGTLTSHVSELRAVPNDVLSNTIGTQPVVLKTGVVTTMDVAVCEPRVAVWSATRTIVMSEPDPCAAL